MKDSLDLFLLITYISIFFNLFSCEASEDNIIKKKKGFVITFHSDCNKPTNNFIFKTTLVECQIKHINAFLNLEITCIN